MRLKFTRDFYIPKGSLKVADKQSDAVAYVYASAAGVPFAMVFVGKADKPLWHYRFKTAERRDRAVLQAFENRREALKRNADRRAERKAWVPDYKVGQVLRTCWGYEQTNVEFFEITEIRGKYAILRELAQARAETGWAQGKCAPLPGEYAAPRYQGDDRGAPIRRLMQQHGIKIDDVRTAYRVDTERVGGVEVIKSANWTAYH